MEEKSFTSSNYLNWIQSAGVLLIIALSIAKLFPETFRIGIFMIILVDLFLVVPTVLYYQSDVHTYAGSILSYIVIVLIALITWLIIEAIQTGNF